jgi:glutathione S-transferase
MPTSLRYLDDQLADGRVFLAGSEPTIADCTLAAALQFGRVGQVPLDPGYQNLARWDAMYRERPAAKATLSV